MLVKLRARSLDIDFFAPLELALLSNIIRAMRGDVGWEPAESRAWLKIVERYGTGRFLDVGANIGHYSILLAKAGCNVYAIEPIKEIAEALNLTADYNDLPVEVDPRAVWSETGKKIRIFFNVLDQLSGGSMTAMRLNDVFTREVETVALDDLELDDVKYVKVDVEGSEEFVLAGASKLLESDVIWMVEYNPAYHKESLLEFFDGYQLFDAQLRPFDRRSVQTVEGKDVINIFASKEDLSRLRR